jgi:glutathione synthase/RimK-type ligase-like ATP-grasp enzyme
VVGISRSPAYSPFQHASNDAAIMEATLAALEQLGWASECIGEQEVIEHALPPAELYLNMGQGSAAARALLDVEEVGLRFFNRPSSVLRCHRQRLVPALQRGKLPFPPTILVRTDRPLNALEYRELDELGPGPLWLKRGGVHAEREGDVRRLERAELERGLAELAARRIPIAAVQTHVAGPVIKFYGVASNAFFHAYLAGSKAAVPVELVEGAVLRALAVRAAARLKLDIFGGDVVVAEPGVPVLIDLNDWPSFAPIRASAARAIAGYVHAARPRGVLQ